MEIWAKGVTPKRSTAQPHWVCHIIKGIFQGQETRMIRYERHFSVCLSFFIIRHKMLMSFLILLKLTSATFLTGFWHESNCRIHPRQGGNYTRNLRHALRRDSSPPPYLWRPYVIESDVPFSAAVLNFASLSPTVFFFFHQLVCVFYTFSLSSLPSLLSDFLTL